MHLTREEERTLKGEESYASQIAMKMLVAIGDVFGADVLIPIESAHISGVSNKVLGDSIDFLETLQKGGARARVSSTINPCSLDLEKWERMPVSRALYEAQIRIIDLYTRMGIEPALTCTPYYLRNIHKGNHLAWSESSAISYANSILGARTNREGGPSALAAALIGKTPRYGLHLDQNRKGNYLVKVLASLKSVADYSALGALVGRNARMRVPVFKGLEKSRMEWLKSMGAGMAASGAVSLYHVIGITPEWKTERKGGSRGIWREGKPEETLIVEQKQIDETYFKLTTSPVESPDLAFVGCPHCSVSEIEEAAWLMEGKSVKKGARFWLCTSRRVKSIANKKGLIKRLENAGVEIYCDTCIIVTWMEDIGIDTLITNSGKAAYYAPQLCGVDVVFEDLNEIIRRITD